MRIFAKSPLNFLKRRMKSRPDVEPVAFKPNRARLFIKFLIIFVPVFVISAGTGLQIVSNHETRNSQNLLSARIGNQVARLSVAIAQNLSGDGLMSSHSLVSTLLSDRAIQCAELRAGTKLVTAVPASIGCKGQERYGSINLPIDAQYKLTVYFNDKEVKAARQSRNEFILAALAVGLLLSITASFFGFRWTVGQPVGSLLNAINRSATGDTAVRIDIERDDELGTVIKAFNNMQSTLQENAENIQSHVQDLEELARIDTLTKIGNRLMFSETLEQKVQTATRAHPVALLLIDLDGFKEINDGFGHPTGDQLLQKIADRLKTFTGPSDILVRLGGDEFAIIHEFKSYMSLQELSEKLLDKIGCPYSLDNNLVSIKSSIGITIIPNDARDAEGALTAADIALYSAKASGKNQFCFFDRTAAEQFREYSELKQDLKIAVENNEFQLHYQPIIEKETGTTLRFEALIRWDHPTRGRISPAVFIPLAEETNTIIDIGNWVLRTACLEAARWPENVSISVNLSARQFMLEDLDEIVRSALLESGLPGSRLQLEITETVFLSENYDAIEKLNQFRKLGCKIALDDFGTGFSSLSQLIHLPIDTLKIDRAFVETIESNPKSLAIIKAIVEMSNELGIFVTAEGVETLSQLRKLSLIGCNGFQGYLISKPVPSGELETLLDVKQYGLLNDAEAA